MDLTSVFLCALCGEKNLTTENTEKHREEKKQANNMKWI